MGKVTPELERDRHRMKIYQCVLTDNIRQTNHTIDWEGVRLPVKEPNYKKRGIREAIAM